MERQYSVYKITSPSGRSYVGLTRLAVQERWRQHKKVNKNHPFYNAIKKYGAENFKIETLLSRLTLEEAQENEIRFIAGQQNPYNISIGGENDAKQGGKTFWASMGVEERRLFVAKLSNIKKSKDWTDYDKMGELAKEWRKENPLKAYKNSIRAIRIANKNRPEIHKQERSLKDKLLWKHRRYLATQRSVTKIWAERTDEQKQQIGEKISAAQIKRLEKISDEDKKKSAANARANIDRKKQGAAASKGIKLFWENLRKDPIAYNNYITKRTKSLNENLRHNKCGAKK